MKPARSKNQHQNRSPLPPVPAANPDGPHKLQLILAISCALVATLLYINTWNHGYVLDDVAVIGQNRFTQMGVEGIPRMLTTFYWEGYWSSNAGLYRPLSLITFAVEHQVFPDNPRVAHIVNTLLYGLIAFLLFHFLNMLFKNRTLWLPLVATMVFVLHPVHTEVVANIKSRDELLCFLFFILAAIQWLRWYNDRKPGRLVFAAALYFLGMFSKEGGVLFLPIFPLLLYFFREESPRGALQASWAMAIPVVVFLAIHTWVIQGSDSPRIDYTYQDNALLAAPDFASRMATALTTTLHYLRLLVWPHPLSHDYSYNEMPMVGFDNAAAPAALAIIAVLAIVVLRGLRTRSLLSFAILWFAITFSLTSNLVILVGATMAERFLFAPSLGFALAAAFVICRYLVKDSRSPESMPGFLTQGKGALLALVAIAIPFAALTVQRNADWKSNLELYTADLPKVPDSARAHYNYATAYMNTVAFAITDPERKAAEFKKAVKEFEAAVAIDPNYYDAWHNLGIARYHLAEYGQSLASLEKAVHLKNDNGTDLYWMGKSNFRLNRFEEALDNLEKSLSMGIKMDDTYNLLGTASFNIKRYADAIHYYREALKTAPNDTEVMNNLAGAHAMTGDYAGAITLLLRSYELDPRNASTCYFLAISYQHLGDPANGERWLQKARELGMNI